MIEHTDSHTEEQALSERLSLIESMIAEGRQKTESWGWTFVLWGAAYSAAIVVANLGSPIAGWTVWGHRIIAWPITMVAALMVMMVVIFFGSHRSKSQPNTTIGRAIYSIWISMGISMFLLLQAVGTSGKLDQHLFVAIIAAMLGLTNAASSMLLKWRAQFLCALTWWIAAVASCFGSEGQCTIVFLAAIFLCQIVFGTYGMISESRQRQVRERASGALHA